MVKHVVLFLCVLCVVCVANAQKIKVVTEEYPPYNYTENAKLTGMSTEIVQLVLKEAGIQHESIQSLPWARAYDMALTQPNILIFSIGRSQERESKFKWVGVIAPYDVYLFKLKENTALKINSLDDVKTHKTGAVRDDVRAQYLKTKGIPESAMDIVSTDSLNIRKLFEKRIDMFPIDELAASFLAKQEKLDFTKIEKVFFLKDLSAGLYMAFSKNTPDEIVNKCKATLEKIKADGRFDKIKTKYTK